MSAAAEVVAVRRVGEDGRERCGLTHSDTDGEEVTDGDGGAVHTTTPAPGCVEAECERE